jgi:NADP-dependent 3-hydroxy acid dehydrogenase YdfG
MLKEGSGTILFTGATASLRGSKYFFSMAAPKFGVRAMSQSLAREFGPLGLILFLRKGVHVCHIIIDGMIDSENSRKWMPDAPEGGLLKPDDIADEYIKLIAQPKSVWSQEVDLRPFSEKF